MEAPFTQPLVHALTAAKGEEPLLVPALGGSLPDGVCTTILGILAFTEPYAYADESHHAPHEHLAVERLFRGRKWGLRCSPYLGAWQEEQTGDHCQDRADRTG
jgi:hypothetical protein